MFKVKPNFLIVGGAKCGSTSLYQYLNQHPDVTSILKRVAVVIFLLISFYFFLTAKKQTSAVKVDARMRSKQSRFFQGVLMSALNIFPIPFQAYVVTSLLSVGWLQLDPTSIGAYIAGAAMGTFIALYIYILFFESIKNNKITSPKNMNHCIALITLAVAIVTFVNLI